MGTTPAASALAVGASVAYVVLIVYFLMLWVRFAFDLVQALSDTWRPRGAMLVVAEATYTVTDPAIRGVRRLVPPLRLGGFTLDLAFSIVMFAVVVLLYVAATVGSG